MTGLRVLNDVNVDQIDVDLVRQVPLGLAREQGILPLWDNNGTVEVALGSPTSIPSVDDFRVLFGRPVQPFIMAPGQLRELTNAAYDAASRTASSVIDEIEEEEGGGMETENTQQKRARGVVDRRRSSSSSSSSSRDTER